MDDIPEVKENIKLANLIINEWKDDFNFCCDCGEPLEPRKTQYNRLRRCYPCKMLLIKKRKLDYWKTHYKPKKKNVSV